METDKTATDSPPRKWVSVSYESQNKLWPSEGRHILGQFDEDTVITYFILSLRYTDCGLPSIQQRNCIVRRR